MKWPRFSKRTRNGAALALSGQFRRHQLRTSGRFLDHPLIAQRCITGSTFEHFDKIITVANADCFCNFTDGHIACCHQSFCSFDSPLPDELLNAAVEIFAGCFAELCFSDAQLCRNNTECQLLRIVFFNVGGEQLRFRQLGLLYVLLKADIGGAGG